MKTEKDFEDLFYNSCQHNSENAEWIRDLSKKYWIDLTSHLNGYFADESKVNITSKAAYQLSQKLINTTRDAAWVQVIEDFNQNYWNYPLLEKKPKQTKTEQQKISRKLFKYVWAFFQSMIILKIAVYYFGLKSAENPNEISPAWVAFFFAVSVGSLVYFAVRNRKDLD